MRSAEDSGDAEAALLGDAAGEPVDTIGQRIRASRKAADLNQGALADRLGVTQPTVANWEAGVHDPRQLMLAKLADALGVSLGWLAGGGRSQDERDAGPAAPYMRRPIQHVPVVAAGCIAQVSAGGLDPHEAATDYVPVTYGGGRLAAVFLGDEAPGAGALFVVDFDRRGPVAGETVLIRSAKGLKTCVWPAAGLGRPPCGTVVASIRFH